MIRVSGEFFFSTNSHHIEFELSRLCEQAKRESIIIKFDTNINIRDNIMSSYETYTIGVRMTLNIDDSYYSICYDEHEISHFIKCYLERAEYCTDLKYQYMHELIMDVIKDDKKRNDLYDDYCKIDGVGYNPLTPKSAPTKKTGIEEKVGKKRRIIVIEE